MMKRFLAFLSFVGLVGCLPLYGSIAASDPSGQGTQGFFGNMALRFTVNSTIDVTQLGVFNASGSGIITGSIQVAIYNTDTNTVVTPFVTFNGAYAPAGLGFDVFQTISTVILSAGNYEIVAQGFSLSDQNGNLGTGSTGPVLDNGGGLLTFTGAAYDGNGFLDEPTTCSGCSAPPAQFHQFDAGTFQYVADSSVPEPSSFGMLACGCAGLAFILRRKRSS